MFSQEINSTQILNDARLFDHQVYCSEKINETVDPEKLLRNLHQYRMLLAFSGGADSVLALLIILLIAEKYKTRLKLDLYYLDHFSRHRKTSAAGSHQIARKEVFTYYENLLNQHGTVKFRFIVDSADIPAMARKTGRGFENTGSMVRNRRLNKLAFLSKPALIVTGHQLNDWYETVNMRMQRGCSVFALRPMPVFEIKTNQAFFRPLAFLSRKYIRNFLNENNLPFYEDKTNEDLSIPRNNIRNKIGDTAAGLQTTALNFMKHMGCGDRKIATALHHAAFIKQGNDGRIQEIRIKLTDIHNLEPAEVTGVKLQMLRQCGLYPQNSEIRRQLSQPRHQFCYKNYHLNIENYNGIEYLVAHRGRKNLLLPDPCIDPGKPPLKKITAAECSKRFFIQMPYGKKSVTKIFSEYNLSDRQRRALPVIADIHSCEVHNIFLSVFGLKDINRSAAASGNL